VRVLAIGTTGVKMREVARELEGRHKAEGRGKLGIYFVEDELKREVDWLIFFDGGDYYLQGRVRREATARAIARAEEEGVDHAAIFMNLPYFRKSRFSQP